ncbi:hypothetical protein ACWEN3_01615 [Streptomyces sp. NPDC004561]
MSLRDFLERFRPAGTPGASATGVPVDRTAEREAELAPMLAQLTGVQQRAADVRVAAEKAAQTLRQEAAGEAERLVAAAGEQAPGVRQQAAEPVVQQALREAEAVRTEGNRTASAVRERAGERMPHLVDVAVADALRLTDGARGEP